MRHSTTQTTHPIWQIPTAGGATVAPSSARPSSLTAAALGVTTVLAVLAPWLVHLVPVDGPALGPALLPMFYAPLLAALLLRLPLAASISAVTPIVARLLTGLPPDPVLPGLVLQVALFVVAVRALRRYNWAYVVLGAYLFALATTGLVTTMMANVASVDVLGTLQSGWLGIIILAAMGSLAHKTLR